MGTLYNAYSWRSVVALSCTYTELPQVVHESAVCIDFTTLACYCINAVRHAVCQHTALPSDIQWLLSGSNKCKSHARVCITSLVL